MHFRPVDLSIYAKERQNRNVPQRQRRSQKSSVSGRKNAAHRAGSASRPTGEPATARSASRPSCSPETFAPGDTSTRTASCSISPDASATPAGLQPQHWAAELHANQHHAFRPPDAHLPSTGHTVQLNCSADVTEYEKKPCGSRILSQLYCCTKVRILYYV